jgi:hypothetical protein
MTEGCHDGEAFDMGARIRLEELAMKNLQYRLSPNCEPNSLKDEEKFYLSDEYKRQCIEKINTCRVTLDLSHRDTALEAVEQTINPVGILIFTRVQHITTSKGIVFGFMAFPQRQGEVSVPVLDQICVLWSEWPQRKVFSTPTNQAHALTWHGDLSVALRLNTGYHHWMKMSYSVWRTLVTRISI